MLPPSATPKDVLRAAVIRARKGLGPDERAAARAANGRHLLPDPGSPSRPGPGRPGPGRRADDLSGALVICAYLPLATEPIGQDLLDRLVSVGKTVLVPVVVGNAPLDWCRYPGGTTPGSLRIASPTGPRLGPQTVRTADVVLVPALCIDRHGNRLGRGGGHYDRTLALLAADVLTADVLTGDVLAGDPAGRTVPRLIGVLYDCEIYDELPSEPHDIRVTDIVTPGRGIERIRS